MKLGFSVIGLIIFVVPMLINIVYFLLPPKSKVEDTIEENTIIEWIEKFTRIAFAIALCFIVSTKGLDFKSPLLYISLVFLFLYYVVWLRYFIGGRDQKLLGSKFIFVPLPLAVFPVLYFIFASMWMHNYLATAIMIIFGIAHNMISYKNLAKN